MVASSKFQKWAGNTPIIRGFARRDGEKIYDIMAGFVYSQTLLALVELDVLKYLKDGILSGEELSNKTQISRKNIVILCQSATAIGVLERLDEEQYCLSRLGASLIGVPGLTDMVRHHRLFYEDLVDPVGLLRNKVETHMSKYWPYVFNSEHQSRLSPEVARIYSGLMRSSQKLVAEETLRLISFSSTKRLLDIGGGTGAFIEEVSQVTKGISFCLFDLPQVVEQAKSSFFFHNSDNQIEYFPGNFVDDDLPMYCDTITLIRVLYDHDDNVVRALLKKIYQVLPKNGKVIISEPMSGGSTPIKSGDSYFGFYTMAMSTGRPRSLELHEAFLREVGFNDIKKHKGRQKFITQVISARKHI